MASTPVIRPRQSAEEIVAAAGGAPGAKPQAAKGRKGEKSAERIRAPELALLARLMDTVFEIPGLGVRFGFDAILGLIPGLGDAATSLVSLYLMNAARRYGASRATLARMGLNIAIDAIVGVVPLAGDAFDVYWKANVKNVELLQRHLEATPEEERKLRRGDTLFVAGLVAALALFLGACLWATWSLGTWVVRGLFGGS